MEASATQHILSALPEMMCQRCSRNVSPTASPALHLPLTAVTSIFVICNVLLHGHDFTPPNAVTYLHAARPLRGPHRDTKLRTTDNIHACLASICQPGIVSTGCCARRMLAPVVGTSTNPRSHGPARPAAPARFLSPSSLPLLWGV